MAQRTCTVEGCDRPVVARGWCGKHYQRARAAGVPRLPLPTVTERFWSRVDKNGPVPEYAPHLGNCWLWTGATSSWGYGQIYLDGVLIHTHRWAWIDANGPVPAGLELDHLCRVHACLRPSHLEPVTHQENVARGARLRTHCPHGHAYDAINTQLYRGARRCRSCSRRRSAEYRARVRGRLGL